MQPFKSTQDLSAGEWSQVLKESKWNVDYGQIHMMKYLGVSSAEEILFSEHKTSMAYSIVTRFCAEDFFAYKRLKVDRLVDINSEGETAPSFSNIEYESDKYKSCVLSGSFFLSGELGKYVVTMQESYSDNYVFKIAGLQKNPVNSNKLLEELVQYSKKHNFLIGKKIDPQCNFIKFDKPYTWDDLILPEARKNEIRKNLSNLIDYREIYQKNNLVVKRGMIFAGIPGVGKSFLGKVLCNTIDWSFVWVTPKHLENTRYLTAIVNMCREIAPTVLFLEDIDLYGGHRSSSSNPALLGELMNQLDGIQENKDIITIATTNSPETLEKALLDRPGRFDRVIKFELPGLDERKRMLERFSKDINADFDWAKVAEETDKLTGAHLRELVNLSVINAIDDKSLTEDQKIILKVKHIKTALREVKSKDFSKAGFSIAGPSKRNWLDDECLD
jgi:cell division protease FtsH